MEQKIEIADQADTQNEQQTEVSIPCLRRNPRLVFTQPDQFFGRDFYNELIMEQSEQM